VTARPLVAIVDYGAGNLVSMEQALTAVGAEVRIAAGPSALAGADALIVPGVGAAAPAMQRLDRQGLTGPIAEWLAGDRPFLGVCLGLQLLFEGSDEDDAVTFGTLAGRTRRLQDAPSLPHIGWNQVERTRPHAAFEGIDDGADFYFVHSYAGEPPASGTGAADAAGDDLVLARTTHGRSFVSAVSRGAVLGVQFHPERSGSDGLRFLANFVGLVRAA
jgi:imidazole glycerol phosphate synthase glutamine amidotransferase subunit